MILHKNDDPKERIKKALVSGDVVGLFQAGFDNFMTLIFDRPLPFQTFLDYTSSFIDSFIMDTQKQERLQCMGGTLLLKLSPDSAIQMTADLYFQDRNKKWALKKKEGTIEANRFSDWESAPELIQLRNEQKLEFPITPPSDKG